MAQYHTVEAVLVSQKKVSALNKLKKNKSSEVFLFLQVHGSFIPPKHQFSSTAVASDVHQANTIIKDRSTYLFLILTLPLRSHHCMILVSH